MKRLSIIVFLCGMVSVANVFAMLDSEKQFYLDWVKENLDHYDDTSYITLGMAPDGCWAIGYHGSPSGAKRSAIKECKKECNASSCEVVDRNGRSDFINKKGMPFPVDFKFKLSSNGFQKGEAYRNGEGVAVDYKEAVKWYKQVADENSAAAFWIGMIYDEGGYGITKDAGEAFQWFIKGADMGDSDCQFMVGVNYEYGSGVSEDLEKAISWYQKSAAQGDQNSKDALKRLNVKVSPKLSTSNTSGSSDR